MSEEKEHAKSHDGGHGGGGHGGGHGGGGHEEHEGAPEWLISFADNVTLMMGFFVILLAMNLKPASAGGAGGQDGGGSSAPPPVLDAVIAIRKAFHNPVSLASLRPEDQILIERLRYLARQGEADQEGLTGHRSNVQSIRPGEYFSEGGTVHFDTNQNILTAKAQEDVRKIGRHFSGLRSVIEVRGHASAIESAENSDQALQLSYDRAHAVARILAEAGVQWRQLRLVVCADNDRIKTDAFDQETQQINQRVEITMTSEVLPDE